MFELDTISMIFTNVKKCSPLHAASPCELGKEEKSWNPYVPTPQYCLHWNCFIFKKVLDVMIFSRFLELLPPPPSSSSSPSSSSPSIVNHHHFHRYEYRIISFSPEGRFVLTSFWDETSMMRSKLVYGRPGHSVGLKKS